MWLTLGSRTAKNKTVHKPVSLSFRFFFTAHRIVFVMFVRYIVQRTRDMSSCSTVSVADL